MARIMVTDGGPHPPEEWAITSAETIFPLDDLRGARKIAALGVQAKIAAALLAPHQAAQEDERAALAADEDHCATPLDQAHRLDGAVAAIQQAAAGSEWEAHFQRPEVVYAVKNEIVTHLIDVAHIERQWHADRNPQNRAARAYKAGS